MNVDNRHSSATMTWLSSRLLPAGCSLNVVHETFVVNFQEKRKSNHKQTTYILIIIIIYHRREAIVIVILTALFRYGRWRIKFRTLLWPRQCDWDQEFFSFESVQPPPPSPPSPSQQNSNKKKHRKTNSAVATNACTMRTNEECV